MIKTLLQLAKAGKATQRELFPKLPEYSRGLPMVNDTACADGCNACVEACPTDAICIGATVSGPDAVAIDRGRCISCGGCVDICPTHTIAPDRRTDIAVLHREDLIVAAPSAIIEPQTFFPEACGERPGRENPALEKHPFRRSLQVRVVSTGDSASDLEVAASENPIFDAGRFGIRTVASPRFADALVVTGPVAHAMRDPVSRCHQAMAEPRLVIAVGTAAISGGPYSGGYAEAAGVDAVLPVDAYVPGSPPHPWSILHGLLLAMGHASASRPPKSPR
jgi:Ni,Fe-hydrogenase III small subunit/formate hydrogenlyase subunit 6/NADH:ubiquinone oxidoreductase subunit I